LRTNYPEIIFFSDLSGLRLPIGLATQIKALKCNRGIPDLIILKPSMIYHGLCLEIKTEDVKLLKKNGDMYSDNHLTEQFYILFALYNCGYAGYFVQGFEKARDCIDFYLKGEAEKMPEKTNLIW